MNCVPNSLAFHFFLVLLFSRSRVGLRREDEGVGSAGVCISDSPCLSTLAIRTTTSVHLTRLNLLQRELKENAHVRSQQ